MCIHNASVFVVSVEFTEYVKLAVMYEGIIV